MQPSDFIRSCESLGLKTKVEIAFAFNVDRRTIWAWTSGRTPVPHYVDAQLKVLEIERNAK